MTASQCRGHQWLARKPSHNKELPTKTTITPKSKKKPPEIPPKPIIRTILQPRNSLDMTKDNLKLFVERWRDHPNSPYTLEEDTGRGETLYNVESMSLHGQSPSPPQSIGSSSFEVSEARKNHDDNFFLTVPNVTLDRRASEGCSNDAHIRDPASQIVLAEEIIKLSEHLRSMAMATATENQQTTMLENKSLLTREEIKINPRNNESFNLKTKIQTTDEINEISEKLSTLTRQRKLNGTTFNGSKNFNNPESQLRTFTLKKSTSRINEDDIISEKNQEIIEPKTSTINLMEKKDNLVKEIDLTPPWRRPRTKRRFSETCRDVPRISTLENIHKSMNLDEPTSAKDLLLQLLEEWDEKPGSHLGRKSISVDWATESIARRSMNSLAEYFQSEQKKST